MDKVSFVTLMYNLEDMVEYAAQQNKRVLEAREKLTARIAEIEEDARAEGMAAGLAQAQRNAFPRIALIKLVREATQQHSLTTMGLKEAKDLVDAWVADQISKGMLPGGVA